MGRATKTAAKLRKEKIDGLIYFFAVVAPELSLHKLHKNTIKRSSEGMKKIQPGCAANGPRRRTKPAILRLLDILPFFLFVVPFEAQTTKVIIVAAESEIFFFFHFFFSQCVRMDRPQSRFFSSGVNWHLLASITPPPLPPLLPLSPSRC